jgi:NDP-sugar pyrophosphorylase family protein
MQAILIATGNDPKLRPLTTDMPASMLPIVDRPVMVYAVELLARAGCGDIYVNLQDQARRIEGYFANGERWNVRIQYLHPHDGCVSTGLLHSAKNLAPATTIVLPADALVDVDIEAALAFHRASGAVATAILDPGNSSTPTEAGCVAVDGQGRLQPGSAGEGTRVYRYTGAFILEPSALDFLHTATTVTEYAQILATRQLAGDVVYGYVTDGYCNLLSTFQEFQAAQTSVLMSLLASRQADQPAAIRHPYVEAGELEPGIWIAPNSIIHPSVRLTPPLFIGAGCRIGRDVELGPATIIGSNVVIDDGVTVQESTILSHTYVGQYLHLAQRVAHQSELIDGESGVNIEITDPWLLSGVKVALPDNMLQNVLEKLLLLPPLVWFRQFRRSQSHQYRTTKISQQPVQVPHVRHVYR